MTISEALLPEFDQESGMTKSVLERCPEEKFDFTPHAKSWELIHLATHLANLPMWAAMTLKQDELDIAPAGRAALQRRPGQIHCGIGREIRQEYRRRPRKP